MNKQANQSSIKIKLSVVIPTLYQGTYYTDILTNLEQLGYGVGNPEVEIITIENKLVNEAWNEGVNKSKGEYILVINDDIIIYKDTIEKLMLLLDYHIIACPNYSVGGDKDKIKCSNSQNIAGFCFMFKKENKDLLFPIPEDLLLWYGDNWIYNKADANVGFLGKIHHWESKTILSNEHRQYCDSICKLDREKRFSYFKYL